MHLCDGGTETFQYIAQHFYTTTGAGILYLMVVVACHRHPTIPDLRTGVGARWLSRVQTCAISIMCLSHVLPIKT